MLLRILNARDRITCRAARGRSEKRKNYFRMLSSERSDVKRKEYERLCKLLKVILARFFRPPVNQTQSESENICIRTNISRKNPDRIRMRSAPHSGGRRSAPARRCTIGNGRQRVVYTSCTN